MQRRAFLLTGLSMLAAKPGAARAEAVASDLVNLIADLPGLVRLGPRDADVILTEFFDYNCPYCRHSAQDLRPLLAADKQLGYQLVNFAVLGVPSIEATRVALAFEQLRSAEEYLAYHEKLFSTRGSVGGTRALAAAREFGVDEAQLLKIADSKPVTERMKMAVSLGDSLGFRATPTYVALTEAHSGYLALADKQKLIRNIRACEAWSC